MRLLLDHLLLLGGDVDLFVLVLLELDRVHFQVDIEQSGFVIALGLLHGTQDAIDDDPVAW